MMFWFLLIIAPMTLLILTIYFYLNTWINSLILFYFNVLVWIPIFLLLAFLLMKPIMKDSKNRIHGTFEHRSIVQGKNLIPMI